MLSNKIALKITIKWNAAANTRNFNVDRIERAKKRKGERAEKSPVSQSTANLSSVVCLALSSTPRHCVTWHGGGIRAHLYSLRNFRKFFKFFPVCQSRYCPAFFLASVCSSLSICFLHCTLALTFVALRLSWFRFASPTPKHNSQLGMVD